MTADLVLMIDDEVEEIRKAVRQLTARYDFVYCSDTDAALEILRAKRDVLSAAVVDLVFPHLETALPGAKADLISSQKLN